MRAPFSFLGQLPPFLPTSISGCVLWLKSDLGITTAAGKVSAWADQSGAGIVPSYTQALAGSQPVYTANGGPNNVPYLTGALGTILSSGTTLLTAPGRTIVCAGKGYNDGFGTAPLGTVFTNKTAAQLYTVQCIYTGGHRYLYSDASAVNIEDASLPNATLFNPFVLDFNSNGNGSALNVFLNGGTVLPTTGGTVQNEGGAAGSSVMGRADNGLQGWLGDMFEIIAYNRVLSGAELSLVRAGVARRYGITVT